MSLSELVDFGNSIGTYVLTGYGLFQICPGSDFVWGRDGDRRGKHSRVSGYRWLQRAVWQGQGGRFYRFQGMIVCRSSLMTLINVNFIAIG